MISFLACSLLVAVRVDGQPVTFWGCRDKNRPHSPVVMYLTCRGDRAYLDPAENVGVDCSGEPITPLQTSGLRD